MQETRTKGQEAAEDIFFGQVVINWARWFLLGGSVVLVLWTATSAAELVLAMLPVVALMALNFYLHGRHLAERPANPTLITAASVLYIAVITVMILLWPEATQRGLGSPFFVMYYPVVLAFAFVMPRKITVTYTMATLAAYAGACFLANTAVFDDVRAVEALVSRLITLGAMGGLGTYYWRIQRNRRRAAGGHGQQMHNAPAGP